MGTLTLEELKAEMRASLSNRTDLNPRLTRFLNLAQQRVARLHDFDEMEAISTSTFPFTQTSQDKYIRLPDLRELYSLKLIDGSNSKKLTQLTQRKWNQLIPASEEYTRRRPQYYTIWARTCVLNPLADVAGIECEIWWTKWPLPLSDDTPEVASQYNQKDEILIELGLVYAFNSLGKQEDAQKHWVRARGLLAEAVSTDMEKPDLDITPGPGSEQIDNLMPRDYWNDPFIRNSP